MTKLLHEQEIAKMMEPDAMGDDSHVLGDAVKGAKRGEGGKDKLLNRTMARLKPKELSLILGAEYKVVKPVEGHVHAALKEGQEIQALLEVGQVVRANQMDFAIVPFEGKQVTRIDTGEWGWVTFSPAVLQKVKGGTPRARAEPAQ